VTAYDAVVVGAGPAGSSAALARGARVGGREGAPAALQAVLRRPDRARRASEQAAAFVPETAASTLLVAGAGRVTPCPMPEPITMTMRDRFDAYLAAESAAAGVEVRDATALTTLELDGHAYRLRAGTESTRASYVVGADGANGVTAHLAGFASAHEPAAAIEAEIRVPHAVRARYDRAALIDALAVPGGYAWIFGKGDGLSVGVFTAGARRRRALRPALARFLSVQPDLAGGRVVLQRGHRVPLAGDRAMRRRGGVLLAGDAAALADPLTGEGISYALASGRRAGEAVLAALGGAHDAHDALDGYDRYLVRDLCGDLPYARAVAAAVYRCSHQAVRLVDASAHLRELAARAVGRTLDYRRLVSTLLLRLPGLLRYTLQQQLSPRPAGR